MHLSFSRCERSDFACLPSFSHITYRTPYCDTIVFIRIANLYYISCTFQLLSCEVVVLEFEVQVVN